MNTSFSQVLDSVQSNYASSLIGKEISFYAKAEDGSSELETGTVLKKHDLPAQYFGEGITAFQDTLFQLTWTNHVAFTYVEQDTFALLEEFPYPWDGWGLTHDGTHLIASDGSSTLRFLDPHTREMLSQIEHGFRCGIQARVDQILQI